MKKIILGLMAMTLTLSVMAQTTEEGDFKNKSRQSHAGDGGFKRGENFDNLNLTDAQKQQIKSVNEDFRKQLKDLQKQGSISVDQQRQKREDLMKARREKIEAVLTPEQKKQAESMAADYRGKRNGKDGFERFTKDLNLTPEQTTKIAALNASFKNDLASVRQNASLSDEEKKQQVKTLAKKHRNDFEALLTTSQKEQLKNVRGHRNKNEAVK